VTKDAKVVINSRALIDKHVDYDDRVWVSFREEVDGAYNGKTQRFRFHTDDTGIWYVNLASAT
jgi:hypothetical protein